MNSGFASNKLFSARVAPNIFLRESHFFRLRPEAHVARVAPTRNNLAVHGTGLTTCIASLGSCGGGTIGVARFLGIVSIVRVTDLTHGTRSHGSHHGTLALALFASRDFRNHGSHHGSLHGTSALRGSRLHKTKTYTKNLRFCHAMSWGKIVFFFGF